MFAVIAGEGVATSREILDMASGLPERGAGARIWLDEGGWYAAAAAPASILPEDIFDNQPFVDAELAFVCRVRLDNRRELLNQLHLDAALEMTLSDADILRRAYQRWREETPQHVYGDFAFVAWDRAARRVVAATDHLGTFPLFYGRHGGRILVATQLSALTAHPGIRPTLDLRAVGLMAAGRLGQGWTMFEGISHLTGGELFIFQGGTLRGRKWWRPDHSVRVFYTRPQDYVDEVGALFDAAVAARLRTSGEIAVTLSGGLDSTLVTTTAAEQLMVSGRCVDAFTAVPQPGLAVESRRGWDADDSPWADAVAQRHANIRHRMVPPGGMIPLDILPAVHAVSRTPVRNTANLVWVWKISELALAGGARIVLCGERGNLTFSYVGDYCDANWPTVSRIAGLGTKIWDRVRRGHAGARTVAPRHSSPRPETVNRLRPGSAVLTRGFREAHTDDLRQMSIPSSPRALFVDGLTAPFKAPRVDFMAQFGVDWRDPTGDRRLLERLLAFPLHAFRTGNRPRGLARELGRGVLPDSVRLRRSRGSQTPDEAAWFPPRAEDYRGALQAIRHSPSCLRFLDMPRLESLLEILCTGNGSMQQATVAHAALDAGLFAVAFERGAFHPPVNARA